MLTDRAVRRLDLAALQPSRVQLASVFGTSVRWIGELRASGVLPPGGASLAENVAAWSAYRGGGQADG